MKYLTLVLISLLSHSIYSQIKKPIEFVDYEVEWMNEPWIDTLTVYDQEFSLVRQSPIQDGYIINIYTNNFLFPFGFLIQKIDLSNGNILWSYNEFSEEKYTRRIVKDFNINGDTLNLFLLEESEAIFNFTYPSWDSCHLAILKLDINNGDVFESIRTNHSDPFNLVISKDRYNTSNQIIYYNDNIYELIKSEELERNDSIRFENYIRLQIDTNGYLINSDTLTLKFPPIRTTFNQNFPYGSTSFISHAEASFSPTEKFSSVIIFEKNLSTFDSIQLHNYYEHDTTRYQVLYNLKDGKVLMETAGQFSADFDFVQKFFLFDLNGNILDKVENSINLSERAETILPFGYNSKNEILGFGTYQDFPKDSLTHLFFWKSNHNNGIDTLLDFKIKDKDIFVSPLQAYLTNENDLIAYYTYIQPSYPSEFGQGFQAPRWNFWIKINGVDLGLKSSATDIDAMPSAFLLFPNPVENVLNVQIEGFKNSYLLISSTTSVLEKIDFNDTKELKIDVSHYSAGHYIISLFDREGNITHSEWFIKI